LPLYDIAANDRLIFLTSFALAGLSALGAERLREEGGSGIFVLAAGGTALALSGLFLLLRPSMAAAGLPASYPRRPFPLTGPPPPRPPAAVAPVSRSQRSRAGLAVAVGLALLLAQRGLEAGTVYPTLDGNALHPHLPAFDHIPPGTPWRFAGVGYTLLP